MLFRITRPFRYVKPENLRGTNELTVIIYLKTNNYGKKISRKDLAHGSG
jgi:hypothetical protein